MTKKQLAIRIQRRLQSIPATQGGVISFALLTLRSVLSRELLERIADDAADEALRAFGESGMVKED